MSVAKKSPFPMVLALAFAPRAQLKYTSGERIKNNKLESLIITTKSKRSVVKPEYDFVKKAL